MAKSRNQITIAVVGTGLIGPRHAEAVINCPEAKLLCIVDPNPAAQSVSSRFQVPLYSSIQAMLSSPEYKPDGAVVCTPNHTHVAVSKDLLDAGVHVLCEKPIASDIPGGRELVDFA